MSSEDKHRPYHAKEKASGQEAADAVAAVLQHATEREAAKHKKEAPKQPSKWMLPVGINLGVFAAYLLIAPPTWVIVNPYTVPPIEERVDDLRLAVYMQAMRVEAYRAQNGRLPTVLADAGSVVPGVQYTLLDEDRYELTASVVAEVVRYDSSEPANQWVGPEATGKLLGGS